MAFQQIIGQDHVIRLLQNSLQNQKISHAYCFLGPQGAGKKKVAIELAKALSCLEQQNDSCGKCSNCTLIEKGNHPDVMTVLPEGAAIKITQIRKLQRSSGYKAVHGVTKVILMENAECMTVQAANSLLRFLEEPTTQVVVILMVENIHLLLPTIVSRCQVVRFSSPQLPTEKLQEKKSSVSQVQIASFLKKQVDQSELLNEDEFAGLCQRVIEWGEAIFSGKSLALLTIQSDWVQKEIEKNKGTMILDLVLLWLRDCLNNTLAQRDDQKGFMLLMLNDRKKQAWDRLDLLAGMESVLHARRQLSRYIQPQSVLEQMVLSIQEELVRGKSYRSSL